MVQTIFALGIEADTGPAPKACRRMSEKPGPLANGNAIYTSLKRLPCTPFCNTLITVRIFMIYLVNYAFTKLY